MSWLLFLDESGHDHKNTPYEVRGGVALRDSEIWPFVQNMQNLELDSFGTALHQYKKEIKGCKLLDTDRFRWANQDSTMSDEERRKHCRGFLTKGLEKKSPTCDEFTAYGQACLEMARGVFRILRDHKAKLFAAVIPCNIKKPDTIEATEYLRKDHVFLLERFFDFLNPQQEHGLMIMDEVEKVEDRRFVKKLQTYFKRSSTGRYRSGLIVPAPFFVSSDMAYPVQAADIVIYCLNWGFRLQTQGMNAPVREEIASEFSQWINQLQFDGYIEKDRNKYHRRGIVYVPDPYTSR